MCWTGNNPMPSATDSYLLWKRLEINTHSLAFRLRHVLDKFWHFAFSKAGTSAAVHADSTEKCWFVPISTISTYDHRTILWPSHLILMDWGQWSSWHLRMCGCRKRVKLGESEVFVQGPNFTRKNNILIKWHWKIQLTLSNWYDIFLDIYCTKSRDNHSSILR